jgi:hypothetical protein
MRPLLTALPTFFAHLKGLDWATAQVAISTVQALMFLVFHTIAQISFLELGALVGQNGLVGELILHVNGQYAFF